MGTGQKLPGVPMTSDAGPYEVRCLTRDAILNTGTIRRLAASCGDQNPPQRLALERLAGRPHAERQHWQRAESSPSRESVRTETDQAIVIRAWRTVAAFCSAVVRNVTTLVRGIDPPTSATRLRAGLGPLVAPSESITDRAAAPGKRLREEA